ncbi:MAG TPA: amidohydrolase family protein [Bryobacteraceae bacterium]|nr:amidohydrolase family protein [Bryobacteraceae bacterium]
MGKRLFCFLLLLAVLPVGAQEQRIAIHARRLLDVRTGTYRNDVYILIVGDRVGSVTGSAPANAKLIDLSKQTVLPGLCDCHAHVLGDQKDWSPTAGLLMSSAQAALWGARNLREWITRGFTMLREAGESDPGYAQIALRDSVNKGLIPGPRMKVAGNFVSVTGGHGDADVLSPDQELPRRINLADTVGEVDRTVRRDIKYGADWIKLMATGGVMDPLSDFNVQELSDEQMAEAVNVAHRAGKKVMAHAEGKAGIRAAVNAGVDSIEHGIVLDDDLAATMVKKGTWLVPTLYTFEEGVELGASRGMTPVMLEKGRAALSLRRVGFDAAVRQGVRMVYGVDAEPEVAPKEFDALVRYGLKPLQAIQAATVNAAEMLGVSNQTGTIEPGKFADIIAVDGDPLQDIRTMEHVRFVMKAGEVFRALN